MPPELGGTRQASPKIRSMSTGGRNGSWSAARRSLVDGCILLRMGIRTIGQLTGNTARDYSRMNSFGPWSLEQLRSC